MGWQCIPQPDGCWKVAVLICHYPDCGDNELLIVASGVPFVGDEVWMLWDLHQAQMMTLVLALLSSRLSQPKCCIIAVTLLVQL